jgi:hypothetical protein
MRKPPWKGGKNCESALRRTIFRYRDRSEDMDARRDGDGRRATKAVGRWVANCSHGVLQQIVHWLVHVHLPIGFQVRSQERSFMRKVHRIGLNMRKRHYYYFLFFLLNRWKHFSKQNRNRSENQIFPPIFYIKKLVNFPPKLANYSNLNKEKNPKFSQLFCWKMRKFIKEQNIA